MKSFFTFLAICFLMHSPLEAQEDSDFTQQFWLEALIDYPFGYKWDQWTDVSYRKINTDGFDYNRIMVRPNFKWQGLKILDLRVVSVVKNLDIVLLTDGFPSFTIWHVLSGYHANPHPSRWSSPLSLNLLNANCIPACLLKDAPNSSHILSQLSIITHLIKSPLLRFQLNFSRMLPHYPF